MQLLLLLAVVAAPRLPPAAEAEDTPGSPPFSVSDFEGSRACARCHPRQYLEWRGSAHAYAILDPIFIACSRNAFRQTKGELGDHCIRCHSPIGARSRELSPIYDPEKLSARIREGISCETCHRMEASRHGGLIADANFELAPAREFSGRLHRPEKNTAHTNKTSEFVGRSESCGSCHDVVLHSLQVESAYAEWSVSSFEERRVQCQSCHMLRYSGQAAVDGPLRDTLHRHNFPGVSLPPPGVPNRGYQQEEVGAFLRTALRVSVRHPPSVRSGEPFLLRVVLKNSGTGHNFPSASFRQLWIEVTVRNAADKVLFRTGHLDANGDLMDRHSALAPEGDGALASLSDYFENSSGEEVPYWFASRVVERSLKSLEERLVPYRISVPQDETGGSVSIRVRVLLRSFRPYALRELGLDDLARELPIWELFAYDSDPVPVTDTPLRRMEYRVPDDFATVPEALEHLRDGDRLLVGPGTYFLRQPLDFHGKKVEVRSLYGPLRTFLLYDPTIAPRDRSSVVVFHGGETRETVLSGFTIGGGAGTLMGGIRRGGGIHVDRSSPTIEDNRVVECGATGGVGGGIACSEGHPAIRDNKILRCWAERGGGIALRGAGGQGLLLEGNTLEGNLARQGGGLAVVGEGIVKVERCIFAGNAAVESGGAIHAAVASGLEVDHGTFVFNRAGSSCGAIQTGGGTGHPITNSIFWSNQPPHVPVALSHCLVDFEGPVFPGKIRGFPLFVDPGGAWEVAPAESELAQRIPRELFPPWWKGPMMWRGGNYKILPASVAVDAGDRSSPPDPDDTWPDLGAVFREQPLKGFIRSDVDGDGCVGWEDLAALLGHLHGKRELPCEDAADIDDGGSITPLDAVLLASLLLGGGPAPAPPFPRCGIDPTSGDGLACQREAPSCRK